MRIQDRIDLVELARRASGRETVAIVEVALVALLALLTARLIWTAVTPIGSVGTPPAPVQAAPAGADPAIFARFDPFFQMPGTADPMVVSDLNIDLYGTRVDNVSGRGSAIIAADGGPQRSYVVGEEVLPGVTLHAVAFDSVTVSRGGALEQLFLDQSVPARTVAPAATPAMPARELPVIDRERIAAELTGQPVLAGGRMVGVALANADDGQLLNELGLQAGDVLLSVNRVPVDSAARAANMVDLLGGADAAELEVRRGTEVKTVRFEVAR
jgi:general secretion pathway protein C